MVRQISMLCLSWHQGSIRAAFMLAQGLTALPGYGVHSYTLLLHKYVSLYRHTATLKLPDGNINTVMTELHRLTGKRTAWHGKSAALHMPGFEKGDKLTAAQNRCGYGWQSAAARSILVTAGESKHDHIERFQHVPSPVRQKHPVMQSYPW